MTAAAKAPVGIVRSYLELCRASNLPTVWTNVLAASLIATLSSGGLKIGLVVAAAISVSLSYLGGMALNDVLDVEEDRLKKPQRPIPSGRISRRGAALFAGVLFAAGLIILLAASNLTCVIAGLALIAVIYLYDRLHSLSWLTVLLMASCRFLVYVIAALAVSGTCTHLVALCGLLQFLYIITLTVVARWEKSGDRAFKIPPIPWLLAGISIVDGILMAAFVSPIWFLAGLAGAAATRLLQTQVRGD